MCFHVVFLFIASLAVVFLLFFALVLDAVLEGESRGGHCSWALGIGSCSRGNRNTQ